MKKKILLFVVATCFIAICGSNFVANYLKGSLYEDVILTNINALADVDITIPGGGGITIDPDQDKRCTCQTVSGETYMQCRVEGAFGFIKGRCNQKGEDCNTATNNNDCKK